MDNGASSYRRFRDNGDESGLVEIIRDYKDGLILYLNSFVGNIYTAEELAEDTFVRLGIKDNFDESKGESPSNPATNNKIVINSISGISADKMMINLAVGDRIEMTMEELFTLR